MVRMADYVPEFFYKDGEEPELVESWRRHYQLLWEGWRPSGIAPTASRSQLPAHLSDLDALRVTDMSDFSGDEDTPNVGDSLVYREPGIWKSESVTGMVSDVLSSDPDVAAEAALLAQSDVGLVRKDDVGAYRNIEGEFILAGKVLDMAMVTPDDHLARGSDEGAEQFGLVVADYFEARDNGVIGAGPRIPIDIWIIAGQSNSTERSTYMVDLCTDTPWIVRFNPDTVEFDVEDYAPPSLGSGIARAWWERDASKTGRRVGTVECGIGGTGFTELSVTVDGSTQSTSWDPANTSAAVNLAERCRDLGLAALAAAPPGSRLMGIAWDQGEADRGQPGMDSGYGALLDSLIEWFRVEFGNPILPVLISSFTPQLRILGTPTTTDEIAVQLEDTPRRIEYTAYDLNEVDDSDQGEFIHWSPDAQHRRGAAQIIDPDPLRPSLWDQALLNAGRTVSITTVVDTNDVTGGPYRDSDIGATITGPSVPSGARLLQVHSETSASMSANATASGTADHSIGASYRTPPGLRVSRSGGVATITWGHPPTRVEEFILETTTAGDDTGWTTQTLSAPTAHKHVMAVAAGTPLWARISAVTPSGTSYTSKRFEG